MIGKCAVAVVEQHDSRVSGIADREWGARAGKEDVGITIVIEVGHGGAPTERENGGARRRGHIRVCAVAVIAIQGVKGTEVGAKIGYEQIDVTVVVVVAGTIAHPITATTRPRSLRDLRKCQIAIVDKKLVAFRWKERHAVGQVQVDEAVIVDIGENRSTGAPIGIDTGGCSDVVKRQVTVVEKQLVGWTLGVLSAGARNE